MRGRMQGRTFRRDIAALRTVAVLAVVLFHFGVPGLGGGYVGVDVFFVISGFLMTGIVTRGLVRGDFSLLGFYRARAERIVPALAVLCLALGLLGLLVLDPMTAREIGTSVLAALTFTSNILFWSQDSYFAAGADTKWLLHTWSLSVEWQFYLIFPIVVMAIWRVRFLRERFGGVMIVATVLSFAACAAAATQGEGAIKATFFWLPFRAWELLLGGLVACYPALLSRFPAPLTILGGLAMIAASVLIFGPTTAWPAWNALLPTLGTALVIWAGGRWDGWANLPGVQKIGAWSYSIYLWHWPIVVGLGLMSLRHNPAAVVAGIALSVGLGALSYAFVEGRARTKLLEGPQGLAVVAAVVGLAIPLGLGAVAASTMGLEGPRIAGLTPQTQAALRDDRLATSDRRFPDVCVGGQTAEGVLGVCRVGDPSARDVLIIGDSHAQQLAPRLSQLFESRPGGVTLVTRGGCPVLPDVSLAAAGNDCAERTRAAFDYAMARPWRRVVIAAFWSGYVEPYPETGALQRKLCFAGPEGCRTPGEDQAYLAQVDAAVDRLEIELQRLKQAGRRTTLVLAVPYDFANDPRKLYAGTFAARSPVGPVAIARDRLTGPQRRLRDRLVAVARRAGADVVDPRDTMCGVTCPSTADGRVIYMDNNHIRASMIVRPEFGFLDPYVLDQVPPTP
ncbi:acyltransferase family protein [soil metagenome]